MRLHNRLVKGDLWMATDVVEAVQEPLGLMLYQGMWHIADDSGCLPDDPLLWRQMLFGAFDGIEKAKLRELGDRLIEAEKLVRYEADGKTYLWLKNFHVHQSLTYPSAPECPLPEWIEWVPGASRGDAHFRILAYACPVPVKGQARRGFVIVEEPGDNDGPETEEVHEEDSTEAGQPDAIEESLAEQLHANDVSMTRESQDTETLSKFMVLGSKVPSSSLGTGSPEKDIPEDASTGEREILHVLSEIVSKDGYRYPLDYPKDLKHIRALATRFPSVDLLKVAYDLQTWCMDNRVGKKANWRLRFTHFVENAAKWQRERQPRGSPRRARFGPAQNDDPGYYDDWQAMGGAG